MKRAALATTVALLVAVLAGCTAPAIDEPIESADAAPLVAEMPTAITQDDGQAAFLDYVRENLPATTQIPDATDEQLLAAGEDACAQLESGTPGDQVSVIDDETKNGADLFGDSSVIVTGARQALCPA